MSRFFFPPVIRTALDLVLLANSFDRKSSKSPKRRKGVNLIGIGMSMCVSLGIYLGRGVQQLYGDIKKKKNDKTQKRQRERHRDTSESPRRSESDDGHSADSGCEAGTSRPEVTILPIFGPFSHVYI